MYNEKRVIVSMTSWPKRIGNVAKTIYSLYNQTHKPDSIELNLSIEEFPNKECDLPETLQTLIVNDVVIINWVQRNTKTFKKMVPVLQKYFGEDYYVLTVDDDLLYSSDYIECMLKKIDDADSYCYYASPVIGNAMIYRSKIFEPECWEKITEDLIETGVSDTYLTYYLKYRNAKMKYGYDPIMLKKQKLFNECFPLHDHYRLEGRIQKAEQISKKIWGFV